MQGTNQDTYRLLLYWTMQNAEELTLEPNNVIVLFCDPAFCDHTVGTLPRCSVQNSGGSVYHAMKPTNQ